MKVLKVMLTLSRYCRTYMVIFIHLHGSVSTVAYIFIGTKLAGAADAGAPVVFLVS